MIRPLALAALCAALWSPAQAQDDTWDLEKYNEPKNIGGTAKPKPRDERKAERLAKKDQDFTTLDKHEQDVVIMAIAKKLAALRRRKGIQWVKEVDIDIKVSESDLKALSKKYPSAFKVSRNVSQKENTEVTPGDKRWEPSFEDHTGEPVNKLFDDNKWVVLDPSEDADALRKLVDDALADLGPNDRVTGLAIRSSASTLRCTATENGKQISNLRLSELRALAAKDFVLGYMKSKYGIELPEEVIVVDFRGTNKDASGQWNGTSGPDDPYGTGDKGSGAPYQNIADYAKHRFVLATISLYRDQGKEVKDPDITVQQARVVSMDVDTGEWKPELKIRLPHIKWPRIRIGAFFRKLFHGKRGALPCPEW